MIKKTHDSHSCPAVLFVCLDWRLHPAVENFFQKEYGRFDLCVSAGSLKDLIEKRTRDYFLEQIACSQRLHSSQTVIITMHKDCGAYGGSAKFKNIKEELAFYKKILTEAKALIVKKFPKTKVVKYFIDLEFKKDKWISTAIKIR
ncbi:MAG: carbonic anhydrase [bacterium]